MVQKMLGICETENVTETDEQRQAGASGGTQEHGKMLKRIQVLEGCAASRQKRQKTGR